MLQPVQKREDGVTANVLLSLIDGMKNDALLTILYSQFEADAHNTLSQITDEEGSEESARRAVVHFENQLKVCEAFDMVDGIATAKSNIAIAKSKYKSGNSGELLKTSRELYDWCVATHGVGNEYTILAGNTNALELAKESRWRESRELLMKSTRFTPQYNKGN